MSAHEHAGRPERFTAQHREVQLLQLRRGIGAELFDELLSEPVVAPQRLGHPPGRVERGKEEQHRPLPVGMLGGQLLGVADG